MTCEIKAFDSDAALVEKLSGSIAERLRHSIETRGSASLAVSGGSTPKALFQRLSQKELPWQYVWVTLVDERWVDENHSDSNARLVRENLLQNQAAEAHFVSLKSDHSNPFEAIDVVDHRLGGLAMPFDVVVLGMGGDGHTASFFPDAETLDSALNPANGERCAAIHPPLASHDRITLTLPALLNAKEVVVHITGQEKWQVLHRAIEAESVQTLPIKAVLDQQQTPVTVYYNA